MSEKEQLVVNPSAAFHPLPSSPPIPEISYLFRSGPVGPDRIHRGGGEVFQLL